MDVGHDTIIALAGLALGTNKCRHVLRTGAEERSLTIDPAASKCFLNVNVAFACLLLALSSRPVLFVHMFTQEVIVNYHGCKRV